MSAPNEPTVPEPVDPVMLASLLPAPNMALLALDFDGTLAPIVDNPDAATLLPTAAVALAALSRVTTVAIVSGRVIDDLAHRFAAVPTVTLIGEHGRSWRQPDGTNFSVQNTAPDAHLLHSVHTDVTVTINGCPGWFVEVKPAGLAVHHRNVADRDVHRVRPDVLAVLQRYATQGPFRLLHGHAVDELTAANVSKGDALATLCASHPRLTPVAIGDDMTDEDAFTIAHRHGGTGILVAAAPRVSGAHHRLAEPVDVATFLTVFAARSS